MQLNSAQQNDARAEQARRREQTREQQQQQQEVEMVMRRNGSWQRLSSAQRCDADALSVVFSFFSSVIDLVTAAQSCRFWRAAALRMPSIHGKAQDSKKHWKGDPWPRRRLQALCSSPFRRHVDSISGHFDGSVWTCAELRQLSLSLPHATSINDIWLIQEDDDRVRVPDSSIIHFPAALTSLSLHPGLGDGFPALALTSILQALGRCCPSLRVLKLTGKQHWESSNDNGAAHIPLAGLAALQTLEVLCIEGIQGVNWFPDDMRHVKQLASLRELRFEPVYLDRDPPDDVWEGWEGQAWLDELLTPPHRMQRLELLNLEKPVVDCLTRALMQLLTTRPKLTETLTRLVPPGMSTGAVSLLGAFSKLRSLRIAPSEYDSDDESDELSEDDFDDETGCVRGAFLVRSLTCANLRVLTLHAYAFDDEEAESVAALLSQLRSLILVDAAWPSLAAVASFTRLRRFELTVISTQHSFDATLTHPLSKLRTLRLKLPTPLSEDELAALQSHSQMLPSLRSFKCSIRG